MKLKIVYQSSEYVVVHKPEGISTTTEDPKLASFHSLLETQLNHVCFPVHRLDKDTSGIVLFALKRESAAKLSQLFKTRNVKKSYLALCYGQAPERLTIKSPLKNRKTKKMEPAETRFILLKSADTKGGSFSLIQAFPQTGRFHQIRRHLNENQLPIVGDPQYGPKEAKLNFLKTAPLMLCAEKIEFRDPFSKRYMKLKSNPDTVFDSILKRIF